MANVGFVVEMSIFYVYSLAMAFTEETPTNLKPNLMKVYELESTNILLSITKSVVGLSMFLRGATVYFYIGTLACMFIPIITNSHPYFYVPWLLVALFRCVVFNLFLLMSGFCVCVIFSPIKPACMEFIFIKMLESVIYSYFWLKINRKYVELCRQTGIKYVPFLRHFQSRAEFLSQEVTYRRRRLRTLGNRVPPPPSNRPPPPCVSVDDLDCSSDSDYSLSSLRDSEMTKGSRSLDSLFTKATMDWFIKEALVHQSVEKDDARYEEGLAKRAATFLQRTLGQKPRSARSDEFEVITNLLPLHTTQRYDPTQDEETPVVKETRAVGNREVCSRESESTCVEEEIPLTADGKTLDTCFDDSNSNIENAVEEEIPSMETESHWCENGFEIGHGKNPFVEEEVFRPVFGAYDSVGVETTLRSGKDGSDEFDCSDDESLCPTGKFFGSPACLRQKVPLFDTEKDNSDPDEESHKCSEIERSKYLVDRNSASDTTECGQLQSLVTRNTDDGNESSCAVMKNEALRVNQDPPSDKGPAGSHSQSREDEIDGHLVAKLVIKSSVGAMHGANHSSIGSFTEAGSETKSCDSSISPDILTLDRIKAVVNEAQINHECLNANDLPADKRDLLNDENRLTNPLNESSEVRKIEPLEDRSETSSVPSFEKSSSDDKIKCQDDRWIRCTNELSSASPTQSLSSGTLTADESKNMGADESFEDGSFNSTSNDEQLAVKTTSGENWESKFEQNVSREGVTLETIMWRGNASSFDCAASSTSSVFSQGMTQTVLMQIMGEHVQSEEQIGSLDRSDSDGSAGYQVSVIDLTNCSDCNSINNMGIKHRARKFLPNTRTLEQRVCCDSESTSRNMNFSEETSMDHSASLDRTSGKRLEIPQVELGKKIESCRCCLNCEHDDSVFFSTGSRTNSSANQSIEYTHHGADSSEYTSLVSEESVSICPSRFYSSGKNSPEKFSIDDSFGSNTNSGTDEETSIVSATPEIPSICRSETSGRTSTEQSNKSVLIEKSSTISQANSIDQSVEEYTKLPCELINSIPVTEETISALNDVSAMVRTSGSTDANQKSNSGVEKGSMVELNHSNANENVYDCTTSILESYDIPELAPETLTKINSKGTVNQLICTSTSATSFPNKSLCETIGTTHSTTPVEKCPEVQDGNISTVDFVRESDPVENRWVLNPQSSNSKSQNFVCSSSLVEPLLTKTSSSPPPHCLFDKNVSQNDNILALNASPLTRPLQSRSPDSVAVAAKCNSTADPQSELHSCHSINTLKEIVTSEADSKANTAPDMEVLRILREIPVKSSLTDLKASQIELNGEKSHFQKLINKLSTTACDREDSTESPVTQQFKSQVLADRIQHPPEFSVSIKDSVESQSLEPEYCFKQQHLQSEKKSSEGNHQSSSHNAPYITTVGASLIENFPSMNGADSLKNEIIQNSVEKVTNGNDPVPVTQMPACLLSAKEASTNESETCKETEVKDVELKVRQNLSDDESLLQGTLISIHGALADRLISEKVFQDASTSDMETPGSNDEITPEKGITGTDACVTNKSSTEIPPMFVRKTSRILINGQSSEKNAPTNGSAFAESPLVTSRPGRVYEERERLVSGGCLSSDNPSTVIKKSNVNFVLSFENKPGSPPPVAAPPPGVFQRLMAKFSSPPGPPIVKETLRKFNAMSAANSPPTTNQSQRRSSVESKEWASNNSLRGDGARRPSKISEKASLFDKLATESCSSGKSPKISPRGSRNSITSDAVLKSIKSLEKSSTIGRVVTVERKFPENIPSSEVFRSARAKFSSQPVGSSRSNISSMTSEIKCNPSVDGNSKDRQTDVMSFSAPTCEISASLSETGKSTRQTKISVKSDMAMDDVFEKDKSCTNTEINSHSSERSNVKIIDRQENNLGAEPKSNDSCGTAQKKLQVSPACSTVIKESSGFIDSGGQKAEALHSTESGQEVESAPKETDNTSQPQNLQSTSREEVKHDSTTSSKIHEEDGLQLQR